MSDLDWHGLLPAWALVLCALLVPIVLALAFFTAMGHVDRPNRELRPGEGQAIAATAEAIVLLHGLAQLGFVFLGAWWLPRSTGARIVFLAITIPFCGLVFLVSFFGVMAP